MSSEKFSVLLSTYAGDSEKHLNNAIQSIYTLQTVKPDQIVLVLDGPVSQEMDLIINKWAIALNDVLLVRRLPENVGLAEALNAGLSSCRNEIVARMDSDDLSVPRRFEMQLNYMQCNPRVAIASGRVVEYDYGMLSVLSSRELPLEHEDLVRFAKLRSPLNHPAVIFRKSVVEALGGYPSFRKAQDYALWTQAIVNGYMLGNLQETLVHMRTGTELFNRRGYLYLLNELKLIQFQRRIGFLSNSQFLFSIVVRVILRLAPVRVRKLGYALSRRK